MTVLGQSKKHVLKDFYRKTPVLESLFNKLAELKACNFIKKRLQHRCFPVKFAKFLRTPILKNICGRLLLKEMNIMNNILKALLMYLFKELVLRMPRKLETRLTSSS